MKIFCKVKRKKQTAFSRLFLKSYNSPKARYIIKAELIPNPKVFISLYLKLSGSNS